MLLLAQCADAMSFTLMLVARPAAGPPARPCPPVLNHPYYVIAQSSPSRRAGDHLSCSRPGLLIPYTLACPSIPYPLPSPSRRVLDHLCEEASAQRLPPSSVLRRMAVGACEAEAEQADRCHVVAMQVDNLEGMYISSARVLSWWSQVEADGCHGLAVQVVGRGMGVLAGRVGNYGG